ncbi:MAG: YceI family protein [Bacteroidales bacterium]|jgi:hypothetical protein
MKKIVVFLFAVVIVMSGYSQDKYVSKNGHIWFFSKTPMENIEAHNNQTASYIDIKTGGIAFQLLMKSFKFDIALMEEHFNEEYVESDKFPKAEFKGAITNLSEIKFNKNGVYNVTVEGNLTIHGVTKKVKEKGTIEIANGKLIVKAKFNIVPQDYGIVIPNLVKEKFAKSMEVNVDMTYTILKK